MDNEKKLVVVKDTLSFTGYALFNEGGVPASIYEVELWTKLCKAVCEIKRLRRKIKALEEVIKTAGVV